LFFIWHFEWQLINCHSKHFQFKHPKEPFMKQTLVVILLAIALASPAFGKKKAAGTKPNKASQAPSTMKTSAPANRVQEQLKKLEEEWATAFIKRDAAALGRILADDYYIIDPNGSVGNKAQTIEDITSGGTVFEAIKYDNLNVRVYGTFAIVTGGEAVTVRSDDQSSTVTFRFTDVFALRSGRWQAVSSQLTPSSEVGLTVVKKADGTKEITTPSGLKYIDLVEGKGASPKPGQIVIVHYTGWLEDGTKFQSSHDSGQPIQFPIASGRVIKGWDEGLMSMKTGGKRKLFIPANLAYGAQGRAPVIPSNASLIFDVELVGIR
jgi:peptidylprolyl isomerase